MTRDTGRAAALLAWCDALSAAAGRLWPDMGHDTLKDIPWAVLARQDAGARVLGLGRVGERPALLLEDGPAIVLGECSEWPATEAPALLLEVNL